MIEIKKITEKVAFYSPDNVFLGDLNHAEMMDVRVQIAEQRLEGYYFVHYNENKTISKINDIGEVDCWANTFEKTTILARHLMSIQMFSRKINPDRIIE